MPSIKYKQLREKTYYDSKTFLDKPFDLLKYGASARVYHILSMLGIKIPSIYNIATTLSSHFMRCGYKVKDVKKILYELVFQKIREEITSIRYLEYQPYEMCLYVVKINGMCIMHIKKKTPELYLEAVKTSPFVITHIPNPTMEMYQEAIKQDYKLINMIYNPSYELCEFALSISPEAMLSIPRIHIDLIKQQLQKDGLLLKYLYPFNDESSDELYHMAVVQNKQAIEFVPISSRTQEICKMAVEEDGMLLRFVANQTEEICRIAIHKNPNAKVYNILDILDDSITEEEYESIQDKSCQICFEKYEKNEKIKKIYCGHYYHKDCIHPWYQSRIERKLIPSYTCPLRCNNHIYVD